MDQVVKGMFLSQRATVPRELSVVALDPIATAAAAIERCLAQAHEAGNENAVRLLHAVRAILSPSPCS